jgi:hypothetical protein
MIRFFLSVNIIDYN